MAALNPLPRWQRRTVHISGWLLLASGAVWLVAHWGFGAGRGELPHPLEAWSMRVHGAATMTALFALGVLAAGHVPRGWRQQRQVRTGTLLLSAAALLVLSGYALYYLTPEWLRPGLGSVHAAVGGLMAAALWWHQRGGRR